MGHKTYDSSESDEETNVRHDRFKSERFKDSLSSRHNASSAKMGDRDYNRNSSNKYKERSPLRSHPRRSETTERKESRNKYYDTSSHSKSNKYHKRVLISQLSGDSEKKHSNSSSSKEKVEPSSSKTNSKKLSSILINFDKQVESKRLKSESNPQIGPTLPPQLPQNLEEKKTPNIIDLVVNKSIGPALPPHLNPGIISNKGADDSVLIQLPNIEETELNCTGSSDEKSYISGEDNTLSAMGPVLPPHLKYKKSASFQNLVEEEKSEKDTVSNLDSCGHVSETDETIDLYGPILPPKLEHDSLGPALPPNLKKHSVQGPLLPSGMTSEDLEKMEQEPSEDEDTFGPMPVGKMNMTQYQLDLRAMDIKRKLEEEKSGPSKDITKREEWMLELPPEKASNLGLGPRSFRMKEGPDMSNRSAWTDTPAEKKRKEEMALKGETQPVSSEEVMRTAFVKERNETMDKISKVSKDKNRQETLLEIHQKKLKKKKKKEEKEGKKKERRPFDRNIDLQVHRFDEAQKKAIFKKAQLLDTRFSSGESKYL